jgi:hypothetical protein
VLFSGGGAFFLAATAGGGDFAAFLAGGGDLFDSRDLAPTPGGGPAGVQSEKPQGR